jgi:hypothetical protein
MEQDVDRTHTHKVVIVLPALSEREIAELPKIELVTLQRSIFGG